MQPVWRARSIYYKMVFESWQLFARFLMEKKYTNGCKKILPFPPYTRALKRATDIFIHNESGMGSYNVAVGNHLVHHYPLSGGSLQHPWQVVFQSLRVQMKFLPHWALCSSRNSSRVGPEYVFWHVPASAIKTLVQRRERENIKRLSDCSVQPGLRLETDRIGNRTALLFSGHTKPCPWKSRQGVAQELPCPAK